MICDESWEKFVLYARAIIHGSKEYNKPSKWDRKTKGSTVFGNRDADIFDVFNFWREEILGGQVYSKEYIDSLVERAIAEE